MASFKEQFRDWKSFWEEVVGMWREEHGFTANLLWKGLPWLTLVGIIGIFASPEPYKTIFWVLFIIGIFILLFSLCFVFPYKKWKQDTDKMSFAYKVQVAQENNPIQFISIEPHTLYIEGNEQNRQVTVLQVKMRSLLLKPITISNVAGQLTIPLAKGYDVIVRFQSRATSRLVLSGIAHSIGGTVGELLFDCQDNKDTPRTISIDRWLYIEGQAIITSNIFSNSRLDFAGSVYLTKRKH